uniref:Uncharacterized protein n=1 Tax=Clastoptera arizonana TaxID=38151 RepID=A0A1B6ECY8_9HEMI
MINQPVYSEHYNQNINIPSSNLDSLVFSECSENSRNLQLDNLSGKKDNQNIEILKKTKQRPNLLQIKTIKNITIDESDSIQTKDVILLDHSNHSLEVLNKSNSPIVKNVFIENNNCDFSNKPIMGRTKSINNSADNKKLKKRRKKVKIDRMQEVLTKIFAPTISENNINHENISNCSLNNSSNVANKHSVDNQIAANDVTNSKLKVFQEVHNDLASDILNVNKNITENSSNTGRMSPKHNCREINKGNLSESENKNNLEDDDEEILRAKALTSLSSRFTNYASINPLKRLLQPEICDDIDSNSFKRNRFTFSNQANVVDNTIKADLGKSRYHFSRMNLDTLRSVSKEKSLKVVIPSEVGNSNKVTTTPLSSPPQVPRLVINVGEDSESDENESEEWSRKVLITDTNNKISEKDMPNIDVEKSVEMFLSDIRRKHETSQNENLCSVVQEPKTAFTVTGVLHAKTCSENRTPVRMLSSSMQQEYYRLKQELKLHRNQRLKRTTSRPSIRPTNSPLRVALFNQTLNKQKQIRSKSHNIQSNDKKYLTITKKQQKANLSEIEKVCNKTKVNKLPKSNVSATEKNQAKTKTNTFVESNLNIKANISNQTMTNDYLQSNVRLRDTENNTNNTEEIGGTTLMKLSIPTDSYKTNEIEPNLNELRPDQTFLHNIDNRENNDVATLRKKSNKGRIISDFREI